jgi:hypothetical protein
MLAGKDWKDFQSCFNQTRIKFFDRILTSNPINNILNVWSGAGLRPRPVIKLVIFLQDCRARLRAGLPGKAAGQGCRARLPGKAARQGCRARQSGKAAGQGGRARLHAMVQYAESMVKLDNNAVF